MVEESKNIFKEMSEGNQNKEVLKDNNVYNLQQQPQEGNQQQITQSSDYIGKIIISDRMPAKYNEFYVWINKNVNIDVGSTFLVAEDGNNKIIGLVVDSYSTSTSTDAISEFYSSNVGDPSFSSYVEPRVITIYKLRAVRRDPPIVKPPTSRMEVRFVNQQDIDFLNQTIKKEDRVLAGFVYSFADAENPNSWIPLYYDSRYIAGPEGAHIMITGKSGLAAKTTYALFLIFSSVYWAKRLNINPPDHIIEEINQEIKSYWRWQIIDEKDPMYLFKGIEKTPRPYSMILSLPLVDALHENKGGFIKDGKLVLRLNKKVEIDILKCNKCKFREDRDSIPSYWALKKNPAINSEASLNIYWW